MPGAAHEVVDVAIHVHVDRVRPAGRQRAADDHGGHEPRRWQAAGGEDHRRDRRHEQQLDDPRLRERDVGADGVDRSGLGRWRDAGVHLGWPQPPDGQQEPDRCAPHRRADREVRHDEERGQPRRDVRQPERDLERHEPDEDEGEAARERGVRRAMDRDRRPDREDRDDHAHRAVRGVDRLGLAADRRNDRAVHQRDVAEREAGMLAGHPGAEQHLGEDRDRRHHHEAGEDRPRARGRHRSVARALRDEDDRRQDGQRHRQVRRDELGGEALQHHRSPEQRLDDDEDAGHDRGGEQRAVVATPAEDRDQPDGRDQRTDEGRRDEPVGVLDPGVEVHRWQPVAEAERPVRAAEARVRGAHEPAHGDQDEGRRGSGNRELGESGQVGVPRGRCGSRRCRAGGAHHSRENELPLRRRGGAPRGSPGAPPSSPAARIAAAAGRAAGFAG